MHRPHVQQVGLGLLIGVSMSGGCTRAAMQLAEQLLMLLRWRDSYLNTCAHIDCRATSNAVEMGMLNAETLVPM